GKENIGFNINTQTITSYPVFRKPNEIAKKLRKITTPRSAKKKQPDTKPILKPKSVSDTETEDNFDTDRLKLKLLRLELQIHEKTELNDRMSKKIVSLEEENQNLRSKITDLEL